MSFLIRSSLAAMAVTVPLLLAQAQPMPQQDHGAHHPDALTPAAPAPSQNKPANAMPAMGAGNKMMGGKMMGNGDMGRMMSMMSAMRMMQDGESMGMRPFDHIEGRIAFYRAELGITDPQLPQWNEFADALRGGAKGMRTAMGAMMSAGMPTTAPARADAMVQMMSVRLDAMKATATASKALYAVLTDAQKKTADELLAAPMMGMPMMGVSAMGMGSKM